MTPTSSLLRISPRPFPVSRVPCIAPYWFDNALNSSGINSTVYYRNTSSDFALLTRASREIRRAFSHAAEFYPTTLVIVTWDIDDSPSNTVMQQLCVEMLHIIIS